MKMNFKYAMMAFAALSMGMASCSDKDDNGPEVPVDEGTAFINFRIVDSSDDNKTRAYAEYPALPGERRIERAKVYMFNAAKVLTRVETLTEDVNGVWGSIFEATPGTHYFIATANEPIVSPALNVPLGTGMDYLAMKISDVTEQMFYQEIAVLKDATKATPTGLATDSLFFMTTPVNVENNLNNGNYKTMDYTIGVLEACTMEEILDPANKKNVIKVPVGRAMAKTTLTIEAGDREVIASDATKTHLGKLDNLVYKVANNTYMMYMFPYFGTTQLFQTPLYDQYKVGSSSVGYWPRLHDPNFFADVDPLVAVVNEHGRSIEPRTTRPESSTGETANGFYIMENSNLEPTWSNSTILQLRANFVPSKALYINAIGGKPATPDPMLNSAGDLTYTNSKDYTAATTFYRVWDNYQRAYLPYFFENEADAKAVAELVRWEDRDSNGTLLKAGYTYETTGANAYPHLNTLPEAYHGGPVGIPQKFTDGLCYYMIPIRDKARGTHPAWHDVVRNHFYDIKIASFDNCGYPAPGGGGPKGPGDETEPKDPLYPDPYFCQVSIVVKNWTHVHIDEENIGIGYK
ncbi:Mfa1 family fimbria major subunit [Bacteroides sp. 519]|uniref:Mfa1 family fimbria major subunit n=1 Tax=Bacteroides sp. 519 TaxID=2302937 RepID=UPI0013D21DA5|nr:Mfa1 family fimbria major subunit [Bacteroides sp. 519]